LILAEAVTMALTSHVGKSDARKLLDAASRKARESGKHLREVLVQERAVTEALSPAELDRLFAPENYLGVAEQWVDRVVEYSRKRSRD